MQRKTKIICTLGPAVDSEDMIRALIRGGMNAARFNFSHGNHGEHLERLNRLKRVRDAMGWPVAAILDTKGPEIRIRSFASGTVQLQEGKTFSLTTEDVPGDESRVSVSYELLHEEVRPGQMILIDDGLVAVRVEAVKGRDILCRVENGGVLSANKSINIPGAHIRLPALTEKDVADIRFGVENGFDYIAASFVRQAEDVRAVRRTLDDFGGQELRIIAKIENQEGVDNIDAIIAEADAIMVARGDLGVEIPASQVPILQKQMIRKCVAAGKPVITATQMMDSMIRNPRPTRAEVSDVANAVYDGTSCIMLSGETASGKYPVEALKTMAQIAKDTEDSIRYWEIIRKEQYATVSAVNDAITHTCCLTAMDLNAAAILTMTSTGHSARMISRYRPACPVAAVTTREIVCRRLAICWGVIPILSGHVSSTDRIFSLCAEVALKERLAQNGDVIVITAGVPLGSANSTNLVKAHVVDADNLPGN